MTTQDLEHGSGQSGAANGKDKKDKPVVVLINTREVAVPDKDVTGLQVKRSAITAGLPIDEGFQLLLDQPNGRDKVIGEDEVVRVHHHSEFTAIAPDDNS